MRSVSDTIARLAAHRSTAASRGHAHGAGRLVDAGALGPNPGALGAKIYLPDDLPEEAPLIVVLHGCTQTAAGYDTSSGWSRLADERGFALLYPEQQRANNPNLCFNWFNPADTRRGSGEVQSIAAMIEAMIATHGLDPRRVFIAGLSAGGAMAAAMLATYPELFAAGGIIAGLPHGVANTAPEAFDRMRGHGGPSHRGLQSLLDDASQHRGPWPKLSIWHGTDDRTVSPSNSEDLIAQWRDVHDLDALPSRTEPVGRATRRVWQGADGTDRIEAYSIPGMGHGTPIETAGANALGTAAPFMLDVGLCSTRQMAAFWGLGEAAAQSSPAKPRMAVGATAQVARFPQPRHSPRHSKQGDAITTVIEDASKKAGLMR